MQNTKTTYSRYRILSPKNHNSGCTKSNLSVCGKKNHQIPTYPFRKNHKNHTRSLEKSWRPKVIHDSAVSILISGCREVEEEEEQEIK
jgi:hypothetical protein